MQFHCSFMAASANDDSIRRAISKKAQYPYELPDENLQDVFHRLGYNHRYYTRLFSEETDSQ